MIGCSTVRIALLMCLTEVVFLARTATADEPLQFDRDVAPLLKRHCVKCHGPAKQEAKLNLAVPGGLIHGGTAGMAVVPHDPEASLIWQRVAADEMPPDVPLTPMEKSLLKRWIVDGTPGLKRTDADATDHWAFQTLNPSLWSSHKSVPKSVIDASNSPLDPFLLANLAGDGLSYLPEADRFSLVRRVSFDLIGLPPTLEAINEFVNDQSPDAFSRMVDRFVASPHFGERLGKVWLDAAGYADSNGYFNADSDRPLAFRYRDYVIRSFNADKPFDEFIREQIAGDQLAGVTARPGAAVAFPAASIQDSDAMLRVIELLEATHFLRNGQDGTGESDGNPDEVRIDRYTVLETTMQNISTALLGLTIQCAKCHDHKFEPLTQQDYYSFQAVLIPAFPPEQWMKPNDRIVYASLPSEFETWQARVNKADTRVVRLQSEMNAWVLSNRPRGTSMFTDGFDGPADSLADRWSASAPGDDAPVAATAVHLNSRIAPGAIVVDGRLQLIEGGPAGDKCLSTKSAFDWTPDVVGASIQVTFDLVENRVENSNPAERIGYFLSLHDFQGNGPAREGGVGNYSHFGNILIDGHPSAGSGVFLDYPGNSSKPLGILGKTGYVAGRNYGVRITNLGGGQFELQHLVDWLIDEPSLKLAEVDLPRGGFGFEYCCGRSFVVDNVAVEVFAPRGGTDPFAEFLKEWNTRRQSLDESLKAQASLSSIRPGKIAWSTDIIDQPPQVHVFERGNYGAPGQPVEPAGFSVLGAKFAATSGASTLNQNPTEHRGSGRRLAFANWLTQSHSKPAALMARVQVNRFWQHHFGTGLVATADNFGLSGPPPSHPELLDWLAAEFVRSGWSTKQIVRRIVNSQVYRQSSLAPSSLSTSASSPSSETADRDNVWRLDPAGRRLSRFPVRRLDAEALRDMLLCSSGDLDDRLYGPYVATTRTGSGETIVPEDSPGVRRRSIYLQQRRTQVHSLLQVFDAPSMVFNSTRRPRSTMPLQSLSLLNSEFVVARASHLSKHLVQDLDSDAECQRRAFLLSAGRPPSDADIATMTKFLQAQVEEYGDQPEARLRAWSDLCQMLLIGNAALYVE